MSADGVACSRVLLMVATGRHGEVKAVAVSKIPWRLARRGNPFIVELWFIYTNAILQNIPLLVKPVIGIDLFSKNAYGSIVFFVFNQNVSLFY